MPASSTSDINVLSPGNSAYGINLPASGFFNGTIVDVRGYTTITVSAAGTLPPNPNDAIQIEWYSEDMVFYSLSVFGSNASTFQTVHAVVRAPFMRVRYHANFTGQTNLRIETLLRKGAIAGSVHAAGEIIVGTQDAQIVDAIMYGTTPSGNQNALLATSDPYLYVVPPPNRTTLSRNTVTATLSSAQLDFFGISDDTRRSMTVFNNTTRGNLFIRLLNSPATLTTYDFKVPPQHTWVLPRAWIMYGGPGGAVYGIWDFADGEAHVLETW